MLHFSADRCAYKCTVLAMSHVSTHGTHCGALQDAVVLGMDRLLSLLS